jgi:hypothetical protein
VPNDLRTTINENDNAAPLIQRADAIADGSSKHDVDAFGKALESKPISQARDLSPTYPILIKLQPLIERYREASRKKVLDFHREWERGPNVLFPEFSDMKLAVKLMAADADRRLKDNDVSGAFDELGDAARLARFTGQEPTMISALVQIAQDSIIDNELEHAMWKLGPRADLAQRVAGVIRQFGPPVDMRNALKGEMVMSRVALNMFATGEVKPSDFLGEESVPPALALARFRTFRAEMDAHTIKFYREMIASMPKDTTQTLDVEHALGQSDVKLQSLKGWQNVYVQIVSPVFMNAGQAIGTELALRRDLLNVADLLTERATNPAAFALLEKGANSLDPFTKKPLLLITRPHHGFAIYSVGPDLQDDGGLRRNGYASGNNYDIVAEYPAPPAPPAATKTGPPGMPGFPPTGSGN